MQTRILQTIKTNKTAFKCRIFCKSAAKGSTRWRYINAITSTWTRINLIFDFNGFNKQWSEPCESVAESGARPPGVSRNHPKHHKLFKSHSRSSGRPAGAMGAWPGHVRTRASQSPAKVRPESTGRRRPLGVRRGPAPAPHLLRQT